MENSYGPNNPEPQEMKGPAVAPAKDAAALHAAAEYIEGKAAGSDEDKPALPCKNSLPS